MKYKVEIRPCPEYERWLWELRNEQGKVLEKSNETMLHEAATAALQAAKAYGEISPVLLEETHITVKYDLD